MSRPSSLLAPLFTVLAAGPVLMWATASSSSATLLESDAGAALRRLELTPTTFAAVGASTAETTEAVDDMSSWLDSNVGEIAAADAAVASTKQAWSAMRAKIRSGQASQQEIDSLASLESAKNAAESARSGLFSSAVAATLADLSEDQRALAANVRENCHWRLPTHFLVTDRSEADWVALRDALDQQRIAAKYGEETSSAALAVISAALVDEDVAAAKVSLDSSLGSIQTAWNDAVAE